MTMTSIARRIARRADGARLLFSFNGGTGAWPGMAADLYAAEPAFADALEPTFPIVRDRTGYDPRPAFAKGAPPPGKRAELILLGLVQIGLLDLWRATGAEPDAAIGVSLGEVTAAHAAGALDREQTVAVLCSVAAASTDGANDCMLFGIAAGAAEAERAAADAPVQLDLLGTVSPRMTMLICLVEDADRARRHLQARHPIVREVESRRSHHTARLPSSLPRMERELAGLRPRAAQRPCFLASSGRDVRSDGVLDARYWAWMVDHPFWYAEAAAAALAAGPVQVVQVGAEPATTPSLIAAAAAAGPRIEVFEPMLPGQPATECWPRARREFERAARRRRAPRRAPAQAPAVLDLDDPEVRRDPWPSFRDLQRRGGIHRMGRDGAWMVVDHALVADALERPNDFSSCGTWPEPERMSLVAADPPEHGPLRRIVTQLLTPPSVDALGERARAVVRETVEPLATRREVDVAGELAVPVTERTVAGLLELDDADLAAAAAVAPRDHLGPEGARVGALAARAPVAGRIPLDDRATDRMVRILWAAGTVTTPRHITWTVLELDRHPDLREAVAADPAAARAFLDEMLRLHPPELLVRRVAAVDTQLGETHIGAGDLVLLALGAANRDPRVFDDPDRIVLDRPRRPAFAFGHGPHRCPGARLGRHVAEATIDALLDVMPGYRVIQPVAALRVALGRDPHALKSLVIAPVG
jgi:cytochrome P450